HSQQLVPVEVADQMVVVAGHIHHPGARSGHGENLPDDLLMAFRPVEAPLERPEVDHVPQQVQLVATDAGEEILETVHPATATTQVEVGEPDRIEVFPGPHRLAGVRVTYQWFRARRQRRPPPRCPVSLPPETGWLATGPLTGVGYRDHVPL